VRFLEVVERLAVLPEALPAPAEALMPIVVGRTEWRPGRSAPPDRPGRAAAVLALLFPDEDGLARIVLIERTTGGGHHSGEVSLPGGKTEPEDADMTATALREAAEEVALDPVAAGVRVIGVLESFWIPVSDFAVTPVVAIAEHHPALVASPAEVARIVEAPIAMFLPDAPFEIVERTVRDWPLRYGAYAIDGLSVWGATARVLSQLGAVLAGRV
jgi:8-oxo-dGTP pyrophosphatase MutT (NUDIX family)